MWVCSVVVFAGCMGLLITATKEWKTQVRDERKFIEPQDLYFMEEASVATASASELTSDFVLLNKLTDSEFNSIYSNEGGTKAFNKVNGKTMMVANPGNILYITCQASSEYKAAIQYAFSKMSAVSSKIRVTASTKGCYSPNDCFNVACDRANNGANAWNSLCCNASAKVVESGITFNLYYMNSYSTSEKRLIAMHELGHTFGLKDQPANSDSCKKDITVMRYNYNKSNGYNVHTDYTRFDKANLTSVYGK